MPDVLGRQAGCSPVTAQLVHPAWLDSSLDRFREAEGMEKVVEVLAVLHGARQPGVARSRARQPGQA